MNAKKKRKKRKAMIIKFYDEALHKKKEMKNKTYIGRRENWELQRKG